uniref:transposase n=1 Tax=Psychrilyobacter sp. TaxID=2586924 RepID=UPI003018068E
GILIMNTRKTYSSKFKFKIVLEAFTERETLQKIANDNEIAPSQITRWTDEFKKKGADIFKLISPTSYLRRCNFIIISNFL